MKRRRRSGYVMVFVIVLLGLQASLVFTGTRRIWLLDRELDAIASQMIHRHAEWQPEPIAGGAR